MTQDHVLRMAVLRSEYERQKQQWNAFWNKLMAQPESPRAEEWMEKFKEATASMSENLDLQIQLVEDAHVAE